MSKDDMSKDVAYALHTEGKCKTFSRLFSEFPQKQKSRSSFALICVLGLLMKN